MSYIALLWAFVLIVYLFGITFWVCHLDFSFSFQTQTHPTHSYSMMLHYYYYFLGTVSDLIGLNHYIKLITITGISYAALFLGMVSVYVSRTLP